MNVGGKAGEQHDAAGQLGQAHTAANATDVARVAFAQRGYRMLAQLVEFGSERLQFIWRQGRLFGM